MKNKLDPFELGPIPSIFLLVPYNLYVIALSIAHIWRFNVNFTALDKAEVDNKYIFVNCDSLIHFRHKMYDCNLTQNLNFFPFNCC